MEPKQLHLKGFLAESFPKICFAVGVLGLLVSAFCYFIDSHHFFPAYLISFMFYVSLSLGGLFFVLISFLTRAGWNVVLRRVAEHMMANIGIMAVFFIPILFGMHDLYHWTHASEVAKDHLLQVKAPYLNTVFFIIRSVVYFLVWILLARAFFRGSTDQDLTGDTGVTTRLQRISTYGTLLYAVTVTFAAVDWLMTLNPHWYSTIFGVYFFAGSVVAALGLIIAICMFLRRNGFLDSIITVEHFHDMGKLLFGFNIFWTYIAFSQYFLIWYANIPEETLWYFDRLQGPWQWATVFLVVGHFAIPFFLFLSRHQRRNLSLNLFVALWMVTMQIVDLVWIVNPVFDKTHIGFGVANVATLLGIGGIYFGVLFSRMARHALIPAKDPRLDESLHFHCI